MQDNVIDLALQLIEIESVTGNEKPMSDFLGHYLQERGWQVTLQEVAPNRFNVFGRRPGRQPDLIFNSHIDTVPPYFPASRDDTYLYGRGACDTKSLIAAQLLAAENLLAQQIENIGFLYVVGEEVDHCGMIKANELSLNPKYLIVGEPTESKLVRRQKGILKVRLDCNGIAAHSGYPETGKSAIEPLLDVLQDLRNADWPGNETLGQTTLNIGILQGGRAANVVPDLAHAEVMIRVVTTKDEILQQVKRIVGDRAAVHVISGNDPCELNVLDGYETTVVAFNTDIPYFHFTGKAFLWGAGSILDAHTAGEKIRMDDLSRAVNVYESLAAQLLKG